MVNELRVIYELRIASYEILATSWKLKSTSWNSKVLIQIDEFRVQIHDSKFTCYEFNFMSFDFKYTTSNPRVTSSTSRVTSLKLRITSSIPWVQESFNPWKLNLVHSVSGDNLVFSLPIISWLRLQHETIWVNINFEKRGLTSALKSHPSPDDIG